MLKSTCFVLLACSSLVCAQNAPRTRTMVINSASVSGQSYIGVGLGEIDSERARQLKLKEEFGVEVTRVEEESPAAKAGLKSGDVVLEYNGQRVEGMEQFARFVRETPPGRDSKLTVSRDGNRQIVMVKIGQRKGAGAWSMTAPAMAPVPPMPPNAPGEMPRQLMVWASPRMGIDAEAIDGQLGQFFGVKEGVLVRGVTKGSAAEKAGLKAGDVITKVDGSTVASPADVTRAIRGARTKKTFPLTLMREKRETTVNLTIEDNNEDRSERRMFLWHDGDGDVRMDPGGYQFHFEDGELPMGMALPMGSLRIRTIRN